MSDRYKILLGAASPLYAPLYLAKQHPKSKRDYHNIDFVYAKPMGSRHSTSYDDPLVSDVLDKAAGKRHFIMAVGDPFRAVTKMGRINSYTPYILGALIKNMCFWLLDDCDLPLVRDDEPTDLYEHFKAIVSHPRYMTGYSVLHHYLTSPRGIDETSASEYIWDDAMPELEHKYYDHYMNTYRRQVRFAYITTSIIHVDERLHKHGDRFTVLKFADKPAYKNTIMTGIIVGKDFYETREPVLIDDLMGGIELALNVINNDPEEAAYYISTYTGDVNADRWGYRDYRILTDVIDRVKRDIYSGGTLITQDDVKKGWQVRKEMFKFQGNWALDPTEPNSYMKYFRILHSSPLLNSNSRWAVEPLRGATIDNEMIKHTHRCTSRLTSLSSFLILAFLNATTVHFREYFSVIFNDAYRVQIFWGLLVFAVFLSARQILDILLFYYPFSDKQNGQVAEPLGSRLFTSINVGLVIAPIAWEVAGYTGEVGMLIYIASLVFGAVLAKGAPVPGREFKDKMRRWFRSACLYWEDGVVRWRFHHDKNQRFKEKPKM